MKQRNEKDLHNRWFLSKIMGFTLLEVTVSLAVSAMILVALIGVVRSLGGQLRRLQEQKSDHIELVQNILQQDALAASVISRKGESYILVGNFVSPSPNDLYLESVIYECKTWLDGMPVLVRRTNQQQEIVAKGVRRMVVERMDSQGVPQPISNLASPFPSRARIWLWMDSRDSEPMMFDVSAY
ncbi:MAG: hypothetical protein J0M26_20435 [Planctomycetes bacterium]|nr:hypothetical protein [Planctomycetota bacterium]